MANTKCPNCGEFNLETKHVNQKKLGLGIIIGFIIFSFFCGDYFPWQYLTGEAIIEQRFDPKTGTLNSTFHPFILWISFFGILYGLFTFFFVSNKNLHECSNCNYKNEEKILNKTK